MSEILFGQSYYLRFDPKLWEAMQPYPPLGSLYAASLARSHGYAVALFDAMLAETEDEWEAALQREQPRYAVLFEDNFNYLSKMCLLRMRQAAYTMLAAARRAGCIPIVCGADATDHAAEYLAQGAQFILTGEGEATLIELLGALSGREPHPLDTIQGVVFQDGEGQLVRTLRRPDLRDLDSLPFPAWDLVDVERYRGIWLARHGRFSMNMVTTRGCPFHCNWCAKPIWGQRYNVRSPQNVVAEMRWLQDHYHPDHIWFADDLFGLQPGWLDQFATCLDDTGVHIPFKSLNRADLLLRGETVSSLARAGAEVVWIGAESGSQAVLDRMEKGTRVEQIYAAAERLHQAGIQVGFFLQYGYPGEGLPEIEQTLQMVRDCQPDDIGISVSYPLPGTQFFERVREQLGAKQNWTDSADLAMMYHGPFATRFYHQLYRVTHREFRARKTWRELRNEGLHRHNLRQAGAMLFQWASLPLERLRLRALASRTRSDLAPLRTELDPEAASRPTPQSER
jgi:anaerobic magnesium-protoporphyrin IX monomethyl ester cyclase